VPVLGKDGDAALVAAVVYVQGLSQRTHADIELSFGVGLLCKERLEVV
jgi:hypothetical protein